jgi:hypothetical protein
MTLAQIFPQNQFYGAEWSELVDYAQKKKVN